MSLKYSYNYDILCAACNNPRYFGYTDLPDSKMCCCHGQYKIPTYDRRLGELPEEALKYASPEDIELFNKCVEGLPKISDDDGVMFSTGGEPIPYGSGPHILKWIREALEVVKPKAILEIGFNVGYGSAMFLNLCDAYLLSCDITNRPETIDAFAHLQPKYKGRFEYRYRFLTNFKEAINERQFDMCFIDGGHEEEDVTADIELCKSLKIPHLLFDDYYEKYGPGVKVSIEKFPELELVKDMNNLRLYKVNYELEKQNGTGS